jgi:protein arginine kinase activator
LTYQEFAEKGFLGCQECYHTFADKLNPLLKRIHGNTQHSGKQPDSFLQKSEMESAIYELKEKMKKVVAEDRNVDFEKIA